MLFPFLSLSLSHTHICSYVCRLGHFLTESSLHLPLVYMVPKGNPHVVFTGYCMCVLWYCDWSQRIAAEAETESPRMKNDRTPTRNFLGTFQRLSLSSSPWCTGTTYVTSREYCRYADLFLVDMVSCMLMITCSMNVLIRMCMCFIRSFRFRRSAEIVRSDVHS